MDSAWAQPSRSLACALLSSVGGIHGGGLSDEADINSDESSRIQRLSTSRPTPTASVRIRAVVGFHPLGLRRGAGLFTVTSSSEVDRQNAGGQTPRLETWGLPLEEPDGRGGSGGVRGPLRTQGTPSKKLSTGM